MTSKVEKNLEAAIKNLWCRGSKEGAYYLLEAKQFKTAK